MIWNGLTDDERLRLWKDLRNRISESDLLTKLDLIAKFCAKIPYGSRTLDYYTPADWPTPWEILYRGSFCTNSISLLIFYTITMVSKDVKVDMYLIEDDRNMYLIPVVNDQFVLNYEPGEVSKYLDIKDSFKIQQIFPQERIKTIK